MALTPSQRPTREWPLLILALALVGAISFPLWQGLSGEGLQVPMFSSWTPQRWAKLLFGPEQVVCYCCFAWASMILISRYLEVRRQRKAFSLPMLPTEEGTRILHEDARPLQRRVEQIIQDRGPLILANLARLALGKFIVSRSSKDVSETVRTQAEVDQSRLASSLSTVNYLAWAIPAIGFLGTVRGLAGSLTMATVTKEISDQEFLEGAASYLNIAFDSTFIALFLSLVVMFFVHAIQRDEDGLVIDCQQYCTEHLVNRLYDPESFEDDLDEDSAYEHDVVETSASLLHRGSRLTS